MSQTFFDILQQVGCVLYAHMCTYVCWRMCVYVCVCMHLYIRVKVWGVIPLFRTTSRDGFHHLSGQNSGIPLQSWLKRQIPPSTKWESAWRMSHSLCSRLPLPQKWIHYQVSLHKQVSILPPVLSQILTDSQFWSNSSTTAAKQGITFLHSEVWL